ncbi:hypothetical protein [Natrinema halophilum]|uniref:Uncharacterized protein n=1 Tax=Natrinema halophilum TaxID=1699371 RepID=A0A7D5KXW3_9EURY|nr:hypothetical protein [Natrinema halophilum]QLG49642.1 hypothetical protein HYG82_12605 [Natrinema halophilum]
MTAEGDRTRIRLEEVLDDIRTLEGSIPASLTVEQAIGNLETTLEAYDRHEFDGSDGSVRSGGGPR